MDAQSLVAALSGSDFLARTRELARESCSVEAELFVHLGEVDERELYLECAFSSIFAFCVEELGFSEDAAYYRIHVARAARRMPAIVDAIRSGKVHLAGARLLVPHLTPENHLHLLDEADGKSKRQIEEIVARVARQPDVPAMITRVAGPSGSAQTSLMASPPHGQSPSESAQLAAGAQPGVPMPSRSDEARTRPVIHPLSQETFKVQFTSRAFRDKLKEAQGLLRHRFPAGDISATLEMALDLLIAKVRKERFAAGRKARSTSDTAAPSSTTSRHVPDAIKRLVYEQDGGRCTFRDARGRRCAERGALEFDHVDGFALTHVHDVDRIRLLCRAHNQFAADAMYGRSFMDERRRRSTRPGACSEREAPS